MTQEQAQKAPEIYVDGDACPVKQEVLKVAGRHGLLVHLVGNTWLRAGEGPLVKRVVVSEGADAADDWIAEHIGPGDIAPELRVEPKLADIVERG